MQNNSVKLYIKIFTLILAVVILTVAGNAGSAKEMQATNQINRSNIVKASEKDLIDEVLGLEKKSKEATTEYVSKLGMIHFRALKLEHKLSEINSNKMQIQNAIDNDKLMFIGNSLVEGLRLNNNSNNQFYCKVGISLSGLKSKIYTQIDNADFDVAIIEMGTNELGGWSEDDFKSSYFDLIDHILSNNPSAQVICLSIPPVSANKNNSGTRFNNSNVVKYNNWVEDIATTLDQTTYLDCSDFFGDVLNSNWTGDGIHLSGNIYADWYNYIIDKLGQLYN